MGAICCVCNSATAAPSRCSKRVDCAESAFACSVWPVGRLGRGASLPQSDQGHPMAAGRSFRAAAAAAAAAVIRAIPLPSTHAPRLLQWCAPWRRQQTAPTASAGWHPMRRRCWSAMCRRECRRATAAPPAAGQPEAACPTCRPLSPACRAARRAPTAASGRVDCHCAKPHLCAGALPPRHLWLPRRRGHQPPHGECFFSSSSSREPKRQCGTAGLVLPALCEGTAVEARWG